MRSSRSRRAKRYLPLKPGRRFLRETPVATPGRREGHKRWRWEVPVLIAGLILAIASGIIAYRVGGPYGEGLQHDPRVSRVYNEQTGELELIAFDRDGNLRHDTWSYLAGERVVRTERDVDGDGRVDRWEYFRRDGSRELIEKDTDGDGRSDERTLFDDGSSNSSIIAEETR